MTLNRESQGQGHRLTKAAVQENSQRLCIQDMESVLINKLQHKGQPNVDRWTDRQTECLL